MSDNVGFRVNLGIDSITMSLEMLNPLSSTSIGVLIHHGMGVPKIGLDKTLVSSNLVAVAKISIDLLKILR